MLFVLCRKRGHMLRSQPVCDYSVSCCLRLTHSSSIATSTSQEVLSKMSSAGKKDKGKLPVLDKLKAADMNMMVLKRIDSQIEEVRLCSGCCGQDQVLFLRHLQL
jgi:hypothetical protein